MKPRKKSLIPRKSTKKPKKSPISRKASKKPKKSPIPRKASKKSPIKVKSPIKLSPIKLSPRSREYECFKIQSKNDCDKIDRCQWNDDWWSIFKKNKCKSRLFHELKINYPVKSTDFDKIRKRLFDLELKSEVKELSNKEKQDMQVLQAFKDDYVTFTFDIQQKAEFLVELKRAYKIEKDIKKKEELLNKIQIEEQSALKWLYKQVTTKEFLTFVFGTIITIAIASYSHVIIKEILNFYEQFVQINVDADTDYAYNTANKYQSEADKNESNTKWYKESGISGIMKSTAWLLAPIPTGIEYFKEGLGYFYKD